MLKFFRKIRQKLLAEGKLKSYTFYAIGEIILVVVGILIALQINNWNEVRKERAREVDMLLELREALSRDSTNFRRVVEDLVRSQKAYERLMEFANSEPMEDEELRETLGTAFVIYNLRPLASAYETLKTSGLTLSDQNLRITMGTYYENDLVFVSEIFDDCKWYFLEYMVPISREYIDSFEIGVRAVPRDPNNPDFKAELLKSIPNVVAIQANALRRMDDLLEGNEELLKLIDEETGY
ncbi:hypothetical protein VDG1235_4659 [Verrucomicrobiia bacterium DG1235]|nr:hypothetical protein VDG1235_4659 [Verrucomicrobiae bacterium DG1235]